MGLEIHTKTAWSCRMAVSGCSRWNTRALLGWGFAKKKCTPVACGLYYPLLEGLVGTSAGISRLFAFQGALASSRGKFDCLHWMSLDFRDRSEKQWNGLLQSAD